MKSNKNEKDISDDVNKDIYDNIIFIMPATTVEEVIDVVVRKPSENIDRIEV